MNIKALAAIVGTLSLGALATGCATNKTAEGSGEAAAKGAEGGCKGGTEAKGAEGGCKGTEGGCKGGTEAKGTEGGCGANGCKGTK
jgi:hypothetical protein